MSFFTSRIHVLVKHPETWKKLHAIDIGAYGFSCTAAELFTEDSNSFSVEEDWSVNNDELVEFVDIIAKAAPKECVIVADTCDMDSDEPPYCVYYLGENVFSDYYEGAASNAWEAYYLKTLGTLNKNDIAAYWVEIDPGMNEVYPGGKCEDNISDIIMDLLYNMEQYDLANMCKRLGVPFMAYEDFGRSESFGFQEDTNINNITQWLQYASFPAKTVERSYLSEYGIHI